VNRVELAAFIDGLMTAYLRDKKIAGATVSVVRDTTVLFATGYGWADFDKRTPVDAALRLFRVGSITKTFTWTAVMQLVEQGKLDLDRDINSYLDFRIPATYAEPITLAHVLTHTAGFEEGSRDLFATDSARITPLGTWLPAHMPQRVRPPGVHSSYSNWATAVAGYIVERAAGMPYDDYVDRFLFEPLGMRQATTRQPLPAALAPHLSRGYRVAAGRWESKPFELISGAWPADSLSASATDMAAWMIAHLNRGLYPRRRILADSTAVRMQTRIQGYDPRLPGYAHGFYEQSPVAPRAIGHGGNTQRFHSDMALLPDEKVGLFVSFNTDAGSAVSFRPFVEGRWWRRHARPADRARAATDAGRGAGDRGLSRGDPWTRQRPDEIPGREQLRRAQDRVGAASSRGDFDRGGGGERGRAVAWRRGVRGPTGATHAGGDRRLGLPLVAPHLELVRLAVLS
jgi:CubicO group peptidase (beta-lactamase class C family)